MPHRFWIVPALGLSLVLSFVAVAEQQSDLKKERARLQEAQLATARTTFESLWADKEFRTVEIAYQWSRRWLDAERLVKNKKPDLIAAASGHLDRMKLMQKRSKDLFAEQLVSRDQVYATDYYVVEAELWVLEARQ